MNKKPKEKNGKSILIQMDTIPNLLKLKGQEESAKELMRQELERDLGKRISRYKELPAIMIQVSGKNGKDEYAKLLQEARKLYVEGKFYSCVIICGVTSERIAKDILRKMIALKLLKKPDKTKILNFLKQLDRIPMDVVYNSIIAVEAVNKSTRKTFEKLSKLRDNYVHARRVESQEDAQKAIKYLHEIVEETVSVFKKYKIQQGKLVLK